MKFTKDTAKTFGQRGGRATVEKHGREHMAKIGVRGWWRMVEKHWNSDARAFMNYFIRVGMAATDPMPQNGAWMHDRDEIRRRVLAGGNLLRREGWAGPPIPPDLEIEPPF
jgi:general stress protein YciG